jgi:hypothetical protein
MTDVSWVRTCRRSDRRLGCNLATMAVEVLKTGRTEETFPLRLVCNFAGVVVVSSASVGVAPDWNLRQQSHQVEAMVVEEK